MAARLLGQQCCQAQGTVSIARNVSAACLCRGCKVGRPAIYRLRCAIYCCDTLVCDISRKPPGDLYYASKYIIPRDVRYTNVLQAIHSPMSIKGPDDNVYFCAETLTRQFSVGEAANSSKKF